MPITCIANSDTTKGPEVPLWECPCRECTRLDWEALDDDRPTLAEFRRADWARTAHTNLLAVWS